MISARRAALVLALSFATASALTAQDVVASASTGSKQKDWSASLQLSGSHHGAPSFRLNVEAEGVVLTPERDAVSALLPGGSLSITHALLPGYVDADPLRPADAGTTMVRTLRVTRGADDQVQYEYAVNGVRREFEREGREWLARLLRSHYLR